MSQGKSKALGSNASKGMTVPASKMERRCVQPLPKDHPISRMDTVFLFGTRNRASLSRCVKTSGA